MRKLWIVLIVALGTSALVHVVAFRQLAKMSDTRPVIGAHDHVKIPFHEHKAHEHDMAHTHDDTVLRAWVEHEILKLRKSLVNDGGERG